MTTLERIRQAASLLLRQAALIRAQRHLIDQQRDEIEHLHLEHAREMRGMVCAWLISIERPEVDLRDDLAEFDTKLSHTIAHLEEHIL